MEFGGSAVKPNIRKKYIYKFPLEAKWKSLGVGVLVEQTETISFEVTLKYDFLPKMNYFISFLRYLCLFLSFFFLFFF